MWGWIKDRVRDIWDAATGALDFLVHFSKWFVYRLLGMADFWLTLLGWMPAKKMRVQVKILIDPITRAPVASRADVDREMSLARRVFRDEVNVRIIDPSGGTRFLVTMFPEIPPEFVMTDARCNVPGYAQRLSRVGRWFRRRVAHTPSGTLGYGSPATIFVVRNGEGSGCFLGWGDYGYIDMGRWDETLAHELGHSCDLVHPGGGGTLMAGSHSDRGLWLRRWQKAVLRSSPRVTYL